MRNRLQKGTALICLLSEAFQAWKRSDRTYKSDYAVSGRVSECDRPSPSEPVALELAPESFGEAVTRYKESYDRYVTNFRQRFGEETPLLPINPRYTNWLERL